MKLIAIHSIIRRVGGKDEEVKPNSPFSATEEQGEELIAMGAAVRDGSDQVEMDLDAKAKPAKGKKGKAEDSDEELA